MPSDAEQVAHRRIGSLVGASDAMSLQLKQPGERSHGRTANAAEMNVLARGIHGFTAGSRRSKLRFTASPQFRFNTEDQGDVLSRHVAAAQSDGDRNIKTVERGEDCVFQQILGRARRSAVEHFAENDAAHTIRTFPLAVSAKASGRPGRASRLHLR